MFGVLEDTTEEGLCSIPSQTQAGQLGFSPPTHVKRNIASSAKTKDASGSLSETTKDGCRTQRMYPGSRDERFARCTLRWVERFGFLRKRWRLDSVGLSKPFFRLGT